MQKCRTFRSLHIYMQQSGGVSARSQQRKGDCGVKRTETYALLRLMLSQTLFVVKAKCTLILLLNFHPVFPSKPTLIICKDTHIYRHRARWQWQTEHRTRKRKPLPHYRKQQKNKYCLCVWLGWKIKTSIHFRIEIIRPEDTLQSWGTKHLHTEQANGDDVLDNDSKITSDERCS